MINSSLRIKKIIFYLRPYGNWYHYVELSYLGTIQGSSKISSVKAYHGTTFTSVL